MQERAFFGRRQRRQEMGRDLSTPRRTCQCSISTLSSGKAKRTDLPRSSLELLSNLPPLDAFVPSRLDEFDEDLLGVGEGYAWRLEVCEEGREGDGRHGRA